MSEDFDLILASLINGNTAQAVGQILESYDAHYFFFEELKDCDYLVSNQQKYELVSQICSHLMTKHSLPDLPY